MPTTPVYDTASVQGLAMRFTQLDATGAPVVGSTSSFVTTCFSKFNISIKNTDYKPIEEVSASGSRCVTFQPPNAIQEIHYTIEIGKIVPELFSMLGMGSLVLDASGGAIGWKAPDIGATNTAVVSVEIWTRAITTGGKPPATLPYWKWVMPYTQPQLDKDLNIENANMGFNVSGTALANDNWLKGPDRSYDTGPVKALQYTRAASYPSTDGYFTVPAPS